MLSSVSALRGCWLKSKPFSSQQELHFFLNFILCSGVWQSSFLLNKKWPVFFLLASHASQLNFFFSIKKRGNAWVSSQVDFRRCRRTYVSIFGERKKPKTLAIMLSSCFRSNWPRRTIFYLARQLKRALERVYFSVCAGHWPLIQATTKKWWNKWNAF